MRFRILGPLEVRTGDGWTAIGASKWRSLLACLLVEPGHLVPTDLLIDELWGDSPPGTANNLVSIYVHRLRKLIGDGQGRVLVYRAPGYLLRLAPGDLDLHEFESRFAAGREALAADDLVRAAELLSGALSLWRGPLLADVPISPLIGSHTDRVAELRLAATELRIEADLACGRSGQVVPELRGLVQEQPLRERFWLLLMRALEDEGRRAEAFETFAQAREVIAAELGVEPGAELQLFFRELLAEDTSPPVVPQQRRPRVPSPSPADGETVVPGAADEPESSLAAGVAEADQAVEAGAEDGAGSADSAGSIAVGTFVGLPLAEPAPSADAALPDAGQLTAGLAEAATARPAQLPADIGDFTGRQAHVSRLCDLLLAVNVTSPGAVRIAVVNGAGGLGKTTLAVHAAHQVSTEFPDGQLYVDLLGASSQPAAPGEVLARFLRDLGVPGDKVPARDDERSALFRTTLNGRRMLILLDNAKDAAQVRSLLPGSSSCAVLVTTRNHTSELAGTRFFDLNVLEDTEALELFSRIVGERAVAEPDATAEVLVACAGLPLAIRICAARLAARRGWRVGTLAARLRDANRRLDEMKTGDLAVRASFQVSYDSLRPTGGGIDPARAFRLLGLWEGVTISLSAAAALLGEPEDAVSDVLESLVDVNLLESPIPDLYRFHDLLKVYATECAEAAESESARGEAVSRLLWWYLESAEAAADMVSPQRYQVPLTLRAADYPPLVFATLEEALAWYDDERANIVAVTRQAAAADLHGVAARLPSTLFPMLSRRSNWADCVTTHRVAAESAAKSGDLLGEAWALNQIGYALVQMRDPGAFAPLERALAVRNELGDVRGEAQTAIALGSAHLVMHGAGEEALRHLLRAASLLEPMGAVSLRSVALNNLGEVYFELGDLDAAAERYQEALRIGREIGGHAEGHALANLGRVYLHQRRLGEAIARLEESLSRHRVSGDRGGEAFALMILGAAQTETGSQAEARASLNEGLRIFREIGDEQQAMEVAELLAALSAARDGR